MKLWSGIEMAEERVKGMTQAPHVTILGICGSLRQASFNRAAWRAAIAVAPQDVAIEEADMSAVPLYDEDVRAKGYPRPVVDFHKRIAAADALLFAMPEYDNSISGVPKNAIDWALRPPDQPFAGKPVAMMGASMGMFGTARAQYHLGQVCVSLDMGPINKPEVMIPAAHTKVDAGGALTDQDRRGFSAALIVTLRDWTLKLQG
jgi:chromate reductase, NAD(P)H dehydrogenase (quinone)